MHHRAYILVALVVAATGCAIAPWSFRQYELAGATGAWPGLPVPCAAEFERYKVDSHLFRPVIEAHDHTSEGGTAPYKLRLWVIAHSSAYTDLVIDSVVVRSSLGRAHRLVEESQLPLRVRMRPDSIAQPETAALSTCSSAPAAVRAYYAGDTLLYPALEDSETLTVRMRVRMTSPARDTTAGLEFRFIPKRYAGILRWPTA